MHADLKLERPIGHLAAHKLIKAHRFRHCGTLAFRAAMGALAVKLVLCWVLILRSASQDPLGGEYFAGNGVIGAQPPARGGLTRQWIRGLCYLASGACAMKMVDVTRERRCGLPGSQLVSIGYRFRRTAEGEASTLRTALDFKRIESTLIAGSLSIKVNKIQTECRSAAEL